MLRGGFSIIQIRDLDIIKYKVLGINETWILHITRM